MDKTIWSNLRKDLNREAVAWPTLGLLAMDFVLAAASLQLSRQAWYWLPVSHLLLLVALNHFYLIHHEAVHGTIFQGRTGNALVGHLMGWLLAYPFLPRQQSHMGHHLWTGHPEGDPTNRRLVARLGALTPEAARKLNRLWRMWIPFIIWGELFALWKAPFVAYRAGDRSVQVRKQMRAARLYAAGYAVGFGALAVSGALGGFLLWFLPAWALLLLVEELINMPHHTETPLVTSSKPQEFWRQGEVTHSCRTVPVWSSCFLLYFNLHTAHHLFPSLPWYRLAKAQRLLRESGAEDCLEIEDEITWNVRRRRMVFLELYRSYATVPRP